MQEQLQPQENRQRQSCDPISLAIEASVTLAPCPSTAAPVNSTTPDVAKEPVTIAPPTLLSSPRGGGAAIPGDHKGSRGDSHTRAPDGNTRHSSGNTSSSGKALLTPEAHAVTMRAEAVEGGNCQSYNITRGSSGKRNGKLVLQDHLLKTIRGTPLITDLLNHYNQVTPKTNKKAALTAFKEERCSLLQMH